MGAAVNCPCGRVEAPHQKHPMWVRATPELFKREVPGLSEEVLARASTPGGSVEAKLRSIIKEFGNNARHLEGLQHLLKQRALEQTAPDSFPEAVWDVVLAGSYTEPFLRAYDGCCFPLYSEEVVPSHEYCLTFEVHSGGAYWSGVSDSRRSYVQHTVETVSASSHSEGVDSVASHFGAAQRGAVFVWRWMHLPDRGPYDLPLWLDRLLEQEGDDPLQKAHSELEAVRRWEQQIRLNAAEYLRSCPEVKDPYIKEVLRLWPCEMDAHGVEKKKKTAWVEGLEPDLFVGQTVLVCREPYDESHSLLLHATICRRHMDDASPENPPYRLTLSWQWSEPAGSLSTASTSAGGGAEPSSPQNSIEGEGPDAPTASLASRAERAESRLAQSTHSVPRERPVWPVLSKCDDDLRQERAFVFSSLGDVSDRGIAGKAHARPPESRDHAQWRSTSKEAPLEPPLQSSGGLRSSGRAARARSIAAAAGAAVAADSGATGSGPMPDPAATVKAAADEDSTLAESVFSHAGDG